MAPEEVCQIFLAGLSFGLYFASCLHCLRWVLFEDVGWMIRTKINWTMLSITTAIFIFTSPMLAIVARDHGLNHKTLGGILYRWTYETIFPDLKLLLIDGVFIYRCWITFGGSYRTISFPVAAWCGSLFAATIHTLCAWPTLSSSSSNQKLQQLPEICKTGYFRGQPQIVFYCCNIAVTTYTTIAIVYRILRTTGFNKTLSNRLYRVGRILTESGILYTLSGALSLGSMVSLYISNPKNSSAFHIAKTSSLSWLFDVGAPLTTFLPAIAFNLVLIRVGEQRATREHTQLSFTSITPS